MPRKAATPGGPITLSKDTMLDEALDIFVLVANVHKHLRRAIVALSQDAPTEFATEVLRTAFDDLGSARVQVGVLLTAVEQNKETTQ